MCIACSYWSWWRHEMEAFSALLAIYEGNSPVPAQSPVTLSFGVFFDLRLNKRLSKRSLLSELYEWLPRHRDGQFFSKYQLLMEKYRFFLLRVWDTHRNKIGRNPHDDAIKWKHFPRYCREFTGYRWIPRKKASDAELLCLFFLSAPE